MPLTQRIFGSEKGQLGKPSIVLLHGWGLNSGVFDPLAIALSDDFCVHLIDLPGFGHNAHEPLTSLQSCAQLVAALIPAHSIVLGWSLGGLVAQRIALDYPEKVSKLICMATSPCFVKNGDWPGIESSVLAQFKTQLAGDYRKTVQRFLAIQALGAPNAKSDIELIKQHIAAYPEPCEDSLMTGLQLLEDVDHRTQIQAITQPTLWLFGRLDALVPVAVKTALARLYADSQLSTVVEIDHVSHAPFISQKQECASYICAFALDE